MKNKNTFIFIVCMCYCICGCYDVMTNHQLSLTNKSDRTISILYSNLADKKLPANNVNYYTSDWNIIKPDSSSDIVEYGGKDVWHDYIEKNSTKRLFIYVFETDSLKKYDGIYSMEEIVNRHKYLKLLSFTEGDLNKINWQITFSK